MALLSKGGAILGIGGPLAPRGTPAPSPSPGAAPVPAPVVTPGAAPAPAPVTTPAPIVTPQQPQEGNWLGNWLGDWLMNFSYGDGSEAMRVPQVAQTPQPQVVPTESAAYPVAPQPPAPATPGVYLGAPTPIVMPAPVVPQQQPPQQQGGNWLTDWLLNYARNATGGPQVSPLPAQGSPQGQNPVQNPTFTASTETESRAVPLFSQEKGKQPKGTETESRAVPAGEDGATFLMRPKGLSGPGGDTEEPRKLTNYEGLADNARAQRLSWDAYNMLSADEKAVADLNKLLVNSREDDLNRKSDLGTLQAARYYANVASVFGPEGTQSETVAPKTVDLLASLDQKALGQDLDDFLSLRKGISADEVKKGILDDSGLAQSVQATASEAFAQPNQQYWNLNSAVRGNTAENTKPSNVPFGFGDQVRSEDVPENDENGNYIWTKDRVFSNIWEGLKANDPAFTPKKIDQLLKFVEFDEKDHKELRDALYLRAMNEKLYGPAVTTAQGAGQPAQRSPDEILAVLGMKA